RNAAVARALGADALLDRSAGHDAIVDRVEDCLRGAARAPDDGQAAAIRRLTQVMARRPELARALEETLYMLADLTGGCAGGVLRRQERGWTLVSQVGTSPGLATLARSGDALDALAAGCQVRDLAACERGQDVLRVLDAGGGVLVPLCARGRVLGALVIAFAAVGPCTDDSLALMQVVATEIALAIAVDDAAHAAGRADAERERRQLERQVQQLQRLDAIGRLTGGVAHDFNNILAVILATSHILMETLEADDPRRADAEEIEKAGERGAMLARQLLTFSRREPGEPTSVDVGAVLHDLESMIRRLIGKEITLAIEIDPELGVARADVAQLEQVVMNLAVNARDAMPTGGTLTLAASNVELDGAGPGQAGGRHIALTVSDTGCGMDARTRDRAFEPFFTTRAASGGSGLGLSTVRDIVTRAGGQLRLSSEPGLGTSVSVYLPRTDGTDGPDGHDGHDGHDGPDGHAALRRAPDAPLGAHRGTETLLVVDGDDRVRATVARVLGGAGYRVLVARDGAAAAQVAGRHDGALALVLTNIVMAGMSAPALMVELRRRWPGVRALFMSGYADHTMVRGLEHGPDTALLQKPFTPEALTRRIRELLDA
ncbi:MAG TPA: ATP-binding protein, partial [Kofleriaceae bacterium]|nr:ATP-binding protein [Kofleriaceae bacterium]